MIFKAELANLVLRGVKTETRRPVKPGETDCRYRPAHTYTVQRTATPQDRRDGFRGRALTIAGARILVTAVHGQRLADIDAPAAGREGFASETEFAHYWMRLYDRGWPPQEEALCPRCGGYAVVDSEPCPNGCDLGVVERDKALTADEVWERFLDRHGDTRVWVIRFDLEQDQLRLLTPTTRPHGSELGYTTETFNAMSDEPESIDPARIHIDWKTRAAAHHSAAMRSTRLTGLPNDEERLEELKRVAAELKVDIHDDVKTIRRRMDVIERKIETRLERKAAA